MTEHAPERNDPVDLVVARTPIEAQILAGVLVGAGIPAWADESLMQDEFTMSQALMNLQQCTIRVRRTDLARAREALKESDEAGALLDRALDSGVERFGEADADGA